MAYSTIALQNIIVTICKISTKLCHLLFLVKKVVAISHDFIVNPQTSIVEVLLECRILSMYCRTTKGESGMFGQHEGQHRRKNNMFPCTMLIYKYHVNMTNKTTS